MDNIQESILYSIDKYTDKKLNEAKFDTTRRARVVEVGYDTCIVEINGEEYTTKMNRGMEISPNDIVYVTFPQNNDADKYVTAVMGGNNIVDVFSDGKLTNIEANSLKLYFQNLQKEVDDMIEIADGVGLEDTFEREACYNTMYEEGGLQEEVEKWIDRIDYPINITLSDRENISQRFQNVQEAITRLLDTIEEARKEEVEDYIDLQMFELEGLLYTFGALIDEGFSDGWLTNIEANNIKLAFGNLKKESDDVIAIADSLDLAMSEERQGFYSALYGRGGLKEEVEKWIDRMEYPCYIEDEDRVNITAAFQNVESAKVTLLDKIELTRKAQTEEYVDKQINDVNVSLDGLEVNVREFSSDNFITLSEAKALQISLNEVNAESKDLIGVASGLNIITEKNNYMNVLADLNIEMGKWINQANYPLEITVEERNIIINSFEKVQSAKSVLINKITEIRAKKAKEEAIEYTKAEFKVVDDKITATVTEKFDGMKIGTRNLLLDSQKNIPFYPNSTGTSSCELMHDRQYPYYRVVSTTNYIDLYTGFPNSRFTEPIDEAGEVVVSLEVQTNIDTTVTIEGNSFETKANQWTKIFFIKTFTENLTTIDGVYNPYNRELQTDINITTKLITSLNANTSILYYRNLMFEKGNKPSDWSAAPEENITKGEFSTELTQNARNIVNAINTTDGIGRVKTTYVIIDESGLIIDNGALTIRDENNSAIITAKGIKIKYIFISSGELNGWQKVGVWDEYGNYESKSAILNVSLPEGLVVESAILKVKSMPKYFTGHKDIPDGFYHPKSLRLWKAGSSMDGFVDCPAFSSYGVVFGNTGKTELTTATWGSQWTPSGEGIREKSAEVKSFLNQKETVFIVDSAAGVTAANLRYSGAMQIEIKITGFLRG